MLKEKLCEGADIQNEDGVQSDVCLCMPDKTELTDEYRFICRVADNVREGMFVHKDQWLNVEINQRPDLKEITLTCPVRTERCKPLDEVLTENGVAYKVCRGLAPLYQYIKQQNEKKRSVSRKVVMCRKVGKYLYKLQPNQGGNLYWYIQFTGENGRSRTVYLGKDKPSFTPQDDLSNARRKRSRKTRATAT
jgi:hypothetical protein